MQVLKRMMQKSLNTFITKSSNNQKPHLRDFLKIIVYECVFTAWVKNDFTVFSPWSVYRAFPPQ